MRSKESNQPPCPCCNDRRWVDRIGACLRCNGAGPVSNHPTLLKDRVVQEVMRAGARILAGRMTVPMTAAQIERTDELATLDGGEPLFV